MFEAIYDFIRLRSQTVQAFNNWLTNKVDNILATIIKKKLVELNVFAKKFTDRLMTYILAVVVVGFLYSLIFYACQFLWQCYRETHLGSILVQSESAGTILAERFFSETDAFQIFEITEYFALWLLPMLMVCRLVYINRVFYESFSGVVTTFLWGIPLAKFFSLKYVGVPFSLEPLVDPIFVQFFLSACLLVHPAMDFVNWFMPELDDLYRGPTYFLKRLRVERDFYKFKENQRN